LIGFDRGLIVLWNVAQSNVQHAYISLQVRKTTFYLIFTTSVDERIYLFNPSNILIFLI